MTDRSGPGMEPPPPGTQPPAGLPYGAQPNYGGQPPYGAQPPGGQAGYSAAPPFGQPPPPRPPRRRRRVGLWLGIGGGVIVAVIILVVAVLLANIGSSGTGGLPSTASGPSACVLAGSPSGGSGPWKLVKPTTLCGLPQDTTPGGLQADQELLSATQLIFNPLAGQPSIGNETSGFAVSYEVPEHLGFTRYVNFVGFDGTFNPQVAVSSLAQQDENPDIPGNVFHPVPAGPHGGAMECAPSYSAEECIFATSTTLGDMMIDDTLGQLTGSHTGTNAIRIRDALEVPA